MNHPMSYSNIPLTYNQRLHDLEDSIMRAVPHTGPVGWKHYNDAKGRDMFELSLGGGKSLQFSGYEVNNLTEEDLRNKIIAALI